MAAVTQVRILVTAVEEQFFLYLYIMHTDFPKF